MGNVVLLRKNQPAPASEPRRAPADDAFAIGARIAFAWTETWLSTAVALAWWPILVSGAARPASPKPAPPTVGASDDVAQQRSSR